MDEAERILRTLSMGDTSFVEADLPLEFAGRRWKVQAFIGAPGAATMLLGDHGSLPAEEVARRLLECACCVLVSQGASVSDAGNALRTAYAVVSARLADAKAKRGKPS